MSVPRMKIGGSSSPGSPASVPGVSGGDSATLCDNGLALTTTGPGPTGQVQDLRGHLQDHF